MAQQQADVAAAEATQAAALAAAAQDAANRPPVTRSWPPRPPGCRPSGREGRRFGVRGDGVAAQASADAQATKQSDDRIHAMDAKAQLDATNAHASAQAGR